VEKEEFLLKLTGSEEEEQEEASTPRLQYYNKVPRRSQSVRPATGSDSCD